MVPEQLARAVDQVVRSTDPAEFAYLALTSKIELPFRDRLAYALTASATPRGERVAREWTPPNSTGRYDLACLGNSGPALLVELKAWYSFNLINQADRVIKSVKSDLAMARAIAGPDPICAAILFITHVRAQIPAELCDTIKYSSLINRALTQRGGAEGMKKRAITEAENRLVAFSNVTPFQMELGSYLEIGVELLGWIAGEPIVGAH